MNESAAKSLATKLAALDLTSEEAEVLVIALGGTVESEVAGFDNFEEITLGYRPIIGAGIAGSRWFVADSFSFGVEREMKESGE